MTNHEHDEGTVLSQAEIDELAAQHRGLAFTVQVYDKPTPYSEEEPVPNVYDVQFGDRAVLRVKAVGGGKFRVLKPMTGAPEPAPPKERLAQIARVAEPRVALAQDELRTMNPAVASMVGDYNLLVDKFNDPATPDEQLDGLLSRMRDRRTQVKKALEEDEEKRAAGEFVPRIVNLPGTNIPGNWEYAPGKFKDLTEKEQRALLALTSGGTAAGAVLSGPAGAVGKGARGEGAPKTVTDPKTGRIFMFDPDAPGELVELYAPPEPPKVIGTPTARQPRVLTQKPGGELSAVDNPIYQPENLALLQEYSASIDRIEKELAAGRIGAPEADNLLTAFNEQMLAQLQGTTPFQKQQEAQKAHEAQLTDLRGRAQTAAGLLNQRVSTGGSVANQLVQAAMELPKYATRPLPADFQFTPYASAQSFVEGLGGGPEVGRAARDIMISAASPPEAPVFQPGPSLLTRAPTAVAPEAGPAPQEVLGSFVSPEIQAILDKYGIDSAGRPVVPVAAGAVQ